MQQTLPFGKDLVGKSRERNLKMKQLREKSLQLGNAESAIRGNYELKLKVLRERGAAMRAAVLNECLKTRTANMEAEDYAAATKKMDLSEAFWDNFNAAHKAEVERVADAGENNPQLVGCSTVAV